VIGAALACFCANNHPAHLSINKPSQLHPTTSADASCNFLQACRHQGPKTDLHPHIITKFGSHSHRYTRQISRERGPIGSLLLQPCSLQGPNTNTLTLIPSPNSDHTQHQTRTSRARAQTYEATLLQPFSHQGPRTDTLTISKFTSHLATDRPSHRRAWYYTPLPL
jgi:hypothetical protein